MQTLVQQGERLGVLPGAHERNQQGVFDDLALGATAADAGDVPAQRFQQPGATWVVLLGKSQQGAAEQGDYRSGGQAAVAHDTGMGAQQ